MSKCDQKIAIETAMKTAMRAKDKPTLGTIRLILADIKRIEVDERIDIDDQRVLSVLDKMLKQRRDSIDQYRAAGRDDLAIIEEQEMVVIQSFLPTPLSEADIAELIATAIADTGASSIKDMGKIMGVLKKEYGDVLDFSKVSNLIKEILK